MTQEHPGVAATYYADLGRYRVSLPRRQVRRSTTVVRSQEDDPARVKFLAELAAKRKKHAS